MAIREHARAALGWVTVCLLAAAASGQTTWPTLHRDYQRSGYTPEVISGLYERKWYRDFHDEMIATRVEAIVAEGNCYVGTFAGRLHALSIRDGRTVWTFKVAGPIGASPCCHTGRLYFGADEGLATGHLYSVSAADGALAWKYDAGAGIWASPVCDGANVYVGDRAGVFHAVSAREGKRVWTFKAGGMILKPASLSTDGTRIVFGAEDMHVYCLSTSGKLLWKSRKLAGLSLRDQGTTIWRGLAIVRTNPADSFHTVMGRNGDLLKRTQLAIDRRPDDKVLLDKWGDLLMHPTPRRRQAEQDAVVRYLRENPHDQTFYALDLADGSEPWIAPVFYTAGLHNPPTPPTFHPETGELYTFYRTALTYYVRGVRRYSGLARLSRKTGRVEMSWPEQRHAADRSWRSVPMIPDETQSLSMMGDWVISNHQGDLGALNVRTQKTLAIWTGRDTYGGVFGPSAMPGGFNGATEMAKKGYLTGMPNEWHGPDRSICAIAAGRIFWVVGSQVVCISGPKVPRTASGGLKPPPTIKKKVGGGIGGNVSSGGMGRFDPGVRQTPISPEQLERHISPPLVEVEKVSSALANELRARLDAEVGELVDGWPWAPFVVQLGISGEERHFWRSSETIQIVALALPHLSQGMRTKAIGFLRQLVRAGYPLKKPVFPAAGAQRREPYDLGPAGKAFAAQKLQYQASIADVYALWAYAHYAGAWDDVLTSAKAIKALLNASLGDKNRFDHRDRDSDACEHLNARIAGVLGAWRILARAEDSVGKTGAREHLARLVTIRVHHERADTELIRPTKVASKGLHQAKVPRYLALVPELSVILGQHADGALKRNVQSLTGGLPVWYQAFGERMIGGENYISPPHLARGLFAALADGLDETPRRLTAKLDQPWCKADLYYIEKLSAVLRRIGSKPPR